MTRHWPLLVIVLAAIGAWYFLAGGFGGGDSDLDGEEVEIDEGDRAVILEADGRAPTPREPKRPRAGGGETDGEGQPGRGEVWCTGTVRDARNGQPVPGARVWIDRGRTPDVLLGKPRAPPDTSMGRDVYLAADSSADGRFVLRGVKIHAKEELPPRGHLWVRAAGFVPALSADVAQGSDVAIELQPALKLTGTVVDPLQRVVEGAWIHCLPHGETPEVIGHYSHAKTDAEGRFVLDGLVPGALEIEVRDARHMDWTGAPHDPADRQAVRIQLVGALRVSFDLVAADGGELELPTVEWTTDAAPPAKGIELLGWVERPPWIAADDEEPPPDGRYTQPVKVPCQGRNVTFTLKAKGYTPLTIDPILLPSEGGEKTVDVRLARDDQSGSVELLFEDRDAQPIDFHTLASPPAEIVQKTGRAGGGAIVMQGSTSLVMPSVPPGSYTMTVRSPYYAPAVVDVDVVAGQRTQKTVQLRPPARVRVQFRATEPLTVTFRFVRDGKVVPAWPDRDGDENENGAPRERDAPLEVGSDSQNVFTGLGGGRVVIEVTDETLRAAPTSVSVVEGETVEVEIEVERR